MYENARGLYKIIGLKGREKVPRIDRPLAGGFGGKVDGPCGPEGYGRLRRQVV